MIKEDMADKKMIMQECAINKLLRCKYIVQLEEVIEFQDRLILVFELMDRDMSDLCPIKSEDFCKFTIYQVAKGLQKMHSHHVLHRDLKSNNILCNAEGDVKVGDLGLGFFLTE